MEIRSIHSLDAPTRKTNLLLVSVLYFQNRWRLAVQSLKVCFAQKRKPFAPLCKGFSTKLPKQILY